MITDSAKEKVISLLDDSLNEGMFGTSDQAASADDTELIAELTSTVKTISGSQSGKQLLITYNILSTEGNGNTFKEYGNDLTNGTSDVLLNRVVFTDLPKTNALEVQVKTLLQVN